MGSVDVARARVPAQLQKEIRRLARQRVAKEVAGAAPALGGWAVSARPVEASGQNEQRGIVMPGTERHRGRGDSQPRLMKARYSSSVAGIARETVEQAGAAQKRKVEIESGAIARGQPRQHLRGGWRAAELPPQDTGRHEHEEPSQPGQAGPRKRWHDSEPTPPPAVPPSAPASTVRCRAEALPSS